MSERPRRLPASRLPVHDLLDRLDERIAAPFTTVRPLPVAGLAERAGLADRARSAEWVLAPASIAVASRLWSAFWMLALVPATNGTRPLPFFLWDAQWYLGIVARGYHGDIVRHRHDFAFFPAWPALIKVASSIRHLHVSAADAGVLLANLLFVVASVLIWRVLEGRFGASAATGGLALLAFAPSAYAFSMAYSEPLFLAATAAYFATSESSPRRGFFAGLAMLTRIAGAAVAAAALVPLAFGRGRPRRVGAFVVLATATVFAIWWVFIAHLTLRFTGFLLGSPSWVKEGSGASGLATALGHPTVQRVAWIGFFVIVTLGAVALLRVDLQLAVFSIAALALALLPGGLVDSMPRYALSAFPAFGGLAIRLGRRPTWALATVFAFAQAAFVAWMIASRGGQAP